MDFSKFKQAVARQLKKMEKSQLFVTTVSGDELWASYISSFPPGTNPEYKKRTEHDCSCCRSFIKRIGGLVTINNGKLESIWDIDIGRVDHGYKVVADAMSAKVKSHPINNVFLCSDKTLGVDKNFENLVKGIKAWEHFYVNVPANAFVANLQIGTKLSDTRASHDVLARSLEDITVDALETVLELISQNSLYRGEEHKFLVEAFIKLKKEFMKLTSINEKDLFVWSAIMSSHTSVSRIRNTAIGTLLLNLSEGMELEQAVGAFEAIVAPTNYRRPTAPVSKAQVEKAKKAIQDLGLTSALNRRFATLKDITINNIIFADRNAKKEINGDVFDELDTVSTKKSFDKVEEISIEKFISDVLPRASSLEIFAENRHTPNFVSLIAPEDPTAGQLFKWNNHFSWSYNGEMADAIKERVKAAGGNVTGDLCCRLAWDYTDDLDFHCHEPQGYHISYLNRRRPSPNGGQLDLDANGADGVRSDPAENIYYRNIRSMRDGDYILSVNNFSRRSDGKGFIVEVEFDGQRHRFEYTDVLRDKQTIEVARVTLKNGKFEVISKLPASNSSFQAASKEMWGIKTQSFHRASVVMMSPNHWDGAVVGNKHYFFMIDGCKNDGTARGFFNEFLKEDLNQHRKVLEMVGGKLKISGEEQLSGLGFSSTARNSLICKVRGSFVRTLKVVF